MPHKKKKATQVEYSMPTTKIMSRPRLPRYFSENNVNVTYPRSVSDEQRHAWEKSDATLYQNDGSVPRIRSEQASADVHADAGVAAAAKASPDDGKQTLTSPPVSQRSEKQTPHILDVIGCHREMTVCGQAALLHRLPFREKGHHQLIDAYLKDPGNYEGRHSTYYDSYAKILDYGNGYIALRLYDDMTRPELGEFLLGKGWKLIGFATQRDTNKTYIIEKWCNIRDH